MTPATLISDLTARRVELRAHGDKVRFRPAEKVTAFEVEVIKQHKPEILKLLRSESEYFANGDNGTEHFSLWVESAEGQWPEFVPGNHYDLRQPSRLRPLCTTG